MVIIGALRRAMEEEEWDAVKRWFEENDGAGGLAADVVGGGAANHGFLLLLAKKRASVDMVELFLRHGADANERNEYGDTALTLAIWHDCSLEFMKALVDGGGGDVNAQNQHGNAALMLAAEMDRVDVVQWLLLQPRRSGVIVDLANLSQDTALTLAIWKRASFAVISMLVIEAGADVNHRILNGNTPLCLACELNDDMHVVNLLLNRGADFNAENNNGDTALTLAAARENGSAELVRALLLNGSNNGAAHINHRNAQGNTALMLAAEKDANIDLVHLLCSHRVANVNARNKRGDTALTLAVWSKASVSLVCVLLAHGADVRSRNECGNTALRLAEQQQSSLMVRLLKDAENWRFDRKQISNRFDAYVETDKLVKEILRPCIPSGDSEEQALYHEYYDKFVQQELTTWAALRLVTVDMLTALGMKLGDAVQVVHAIHAADARHRGRLWIDVKDTAWWWWTAAAVAVAAVALFPMQYLNQI